MSILEVSGLRKVYTTRFGGSRVEALRSVSFTVEQGEYVAIMGESGSGKTTLLNILAALDEPTAGTVRLEGRELHKIREKDAALFRRENLGFVFQEFNLLDTFTLEDNIYLPLVLAGMGYEDMRARLMPIAKLLGLTELLKKYPYEVSGGQKQRAAVARAIITEPKLLLADEPTGAGQRLHRRAAAAVCGHQPGGTDHPDGDPLGEGGQPRRACAVHQGRAGVPPALSGRGQRYPVLPAHLRYADHAAVRR